jgi:hypothetical protein
MLMPSSSGQKRSLSGFESSIKELPSGIECTCRERERGVSGGGLEELAPPAAGRGLDEDPILRSLGC